MTTHSSILVWTIPWTGKPGGLKSWGHKSWTQLGVCLNHNHNLVINYCEVVTIIPFLQVMKQVRGRGGLV